MKKLGKKQLIINLHEPLAGIPKQLSKFNVQLAEEGKQLVFNYDPLTEDNEVANLLDNLKENAIKYKDLATRQSSLEEIFIQLVGKS